MDGGNGSVVSVSAMEDFTNDELAMALHYIAGYMGDNADFQEALYKALRYASAQRPSPSGEVFPT